MRTSALVPVHQRTVPRSGRSWRRKLLPVVLPVCAVLLFPPAWAQVPDRSAPPEIGPPPALKLASLQHLKLSNGLPVILCEKHEVPLVQVNLLVNAGATMDPPGKPGLASMTVAMLTEGAGARSALELADAIDFLGARITAASGYHTAVVAMHTPVTKLDSALALMADVALRPTFPAADLERKRVEDLTTLLQWRDDPRSLASVEFDRVLYGANHPYGVPIIGDEQSIRSFTPDDLGRFFASYFRPNNASLIVVGDVTAASILPKLEKAFGRWEAGKVPATSTSAIAQVRERNVFLVDKPGAPQSQIRIGCIGAPRLTDDYYAIVVMNTILGGSFGSRLNQNLREQHGYTYGAGSRFDFRPLAGPFLASSAVQTAVTDKSITEFMKELNGILAPVSDTELERARNYVAFSYPADFQSVEEIAGELVNLAVYNLPDDYFDKYIGHILAVTKEDVARAARKYLDPQKVDIVIVGDRQHIEAGVQALNLGPLKVLTVGDVLGEAPAIGTKE